jgi:glycerol uptake facilitator protein
VKRGTVITLLDVTAAGDLAKVVLLPEFLGTMMLILLGCGVNMGTSLRKSKASGAGWLTVNWGWGIAVMIGVFVAWSSGGHLNPAVTIGKTVAHAFDSNVTLNGQAAGSAAAVPVTGLAILFYLIGEFAGALVGAILAWLAYKQLMDDEPEPANKLGVFATGPAMRSYGWNLITEILGTFVLVYWVLMSGYTGITGGSIGVLGVTLVIVGIGASLGGPTGYAINPARDLSPRIAHAILPIKGKGDSDWGYAWVPVFGPLIGACIAAILYGVFPMHDVVTLMGLG